MVFGLRALIREPKYGPTEAPKGPLWALPGPWPGEANRPKGISRGARRAPRQHSNAHVENAHPPGVGSTSCPPRANRKLTGSRQICALEWPSRGGGSNPWGPGWVGYPPGSPVWVGYHQAPRGGGWVTRLPPVALLRPPGSSKWTFPAPSGLPGAQMVSFDSPRHTNLVQGP